MTMLNFKSQQILGMTAICAILLFSANPVFADCTKWHPHHCVDVPAIPIIDPIVKGGERYRKTWNYEVKIRNATNNPINYRIDGQIGFLRPDYVETWTTTSKLGISFDNGQNQTIEYGLSKGSYYFQWQNGVLNLFKD